MFLHLKCGYLNIDHISLIKEVEGGFIVKLSNQFLSVFVDKQDGDLLLSVVEIISYKG